jgi:hypothetical protein
MNRSSLVNTAIRAGTTAALALSIVTPSYATPVLSNTAAVKSATTSQIEDVRWVGPRGGRWGGGAVAAGIIAGLALGAIVSAPYSYAPSYGYGPSPYYGYYGYSPYGGSGHFQDQFRNSY